MGRWRRKALVPGVYDELVSERLRQELEALDSTKWTARHRELTNHEDIRAPVAALLDEAIDLALAEFKDKPVEAIALAEEILGVLKKHAQKTFPQGHELSLRKERLESIVAKGSKEPTAPQASLHASRLIVNAAGESLLGHLRSEFETADRIDLLCAFVKVSGFEKIRRELELHCVSRARPLRVLTTTYMGASDGKAVERFARLSNARVKVSFDEAVTRLHAKAWIFHRASGYSTAYVGSSNLSHAAQTEGLEWNVRVTESDQPAVFAQMVETFEQYWADETQFEPFDR